MEREEPREMRYKKKLLEKMQKLDMNKDEYALFLLQGIKKEVMLIRAILERTERTEQENQEY